MMANGTLETIINEALIPITLGDVTQVMAVKIIPGLTDVCVLGMDFAEKFGLAIHARDKEVWMADEQLIVFLRNSGRRRV